ncbi:MAG: hypothetical protein K6F14_02740 [Clostridiales bacterium]|nr:hypothetical protein [Clostridiales bacterium]
MKNHSFKIIKRVSTATISILLCLMFVVSTVSAPALNTFNYSDSNENMYTNSVAPSILVELITGSTYTAFEKEYLDTIQDYYLRYNTQISTDYVDLEAVGSIIFVSARSYTAITKNNKMIKWVPVSATCNGVTLPLTSNGAVYECQFDNVKPDTSYPIKVNYSATIDIVPGDANLLANKVYNDALDVKTIMNTYQSQLEKYNVSANAYASYQKQYELYKTELERYNKYLADKETYNIQVSEYQQYLKDCKVYEEELVKYGEYLVALEEYNTAYAQYQEDLEKFKQNSEKYAEYLEYIAKIEKCEDYLKYMDRIFMNSAEGHSMYGTIVGGTVDTVLNNKEQLVSYGGVSPEDIDNAGTATVALRTLLGEYSNLKTNEARFNWYKEKHDALLSAFSLLYSSLYSLLKNRAVYVELSKRDKLTRFYQFISQMYVICTNLDDNAALSKDWYIYDIKSKTNLTLMQVLEPDLYFEDTNNSVPTNTNWPTEVEKVEIPTSSTVPEKPATMYEPMPPTVVTEPVEPEVVTMPTAPTVVPAPGAKPSEPILSSVQKNLLAELENGTLKKRVNVTSTYSYKIETTINTFLTAADIYPYPVVTFVNYNGTVIVDLVLKNPSDVQGIMPDIPTSAYEKYTFEYWETTGGTRVDFNNVNRNMTVYPHFSTSEAKYEITWQLKGKSYKVTCSYGETPTFPGTIEPYYDDEYEYTFVSWDKDIVPTTEDTTYTAKYSTEKRSYDIQWIIDKSIFVSTCEYGTIPVCPETELDYYTDDSFYEFTGWDKEIAAVTGETTYTARFLKHELIKEQSGKTISVTRDSNSFAISLPDNSGVLDISNLAGLVSSNNLKVTVNSNNNAIELPAEYVKTYVSNGIIVSFSTSNPTEGSVVFNVSVTDAEGKPISTNGLIIKYYEPDSTEYACYYVSGLEKINCTLYRQADYFVLTMNGESHSYTFEKVKGNTEEEYYIVNFYLEGQLYSSGKYKFGEQLFMPYTPTKEGNDEYEYSFSGWSPTVVTTVTKSVDYNGYFKETKKAGSGDYNVSPHTTLYPIHLLFIGFAIVEVLTVGITFLVKFIMTKKKKHD